MLTAEVSEEIKAIRVLPFSGQQQDSDEWWVAAERGYLQEMLGNEDVPTDVLDIDQQVEIRYLIPDENVRKKKHLTRKRNQKGYRDLQLSTSKLAFQLVSLVKTRELPNGSLAKAWASARMSMIHQKEKIKLNS